MGEQHALLARCGCQAQAHIAIRQAAGKLHGKRIYLAGSHGANSRIDKLGPLQAFLTNAVQKTIVPGAHG